MTPKVVDPCSTLLQRAKQSVHQHLPVANYAEANRDGS